MHSLMPFVPLFVFYARSNHEHINLGQEKLQKAIDTALTHEKAQPLFDKVPRLIGVVQHLHVLYLVGWSETALARLCYGAFSSYR